MLLKFNPLAAELCVNCLPLAVVAACYEPWRKGASNPFTVGLASLFNPIVAGAECKYNPFTVRAA
jgi:hypothetical protein